MTAEPVSAAPVGERGRPWWPTALVATTVLMFAGGLPLADAYVPDISQGDGTRGPAVRRVPEQPSEDPYVSPDRSISFVPAANWSVDGHQAGATTLESGGASLEIRTLPAASSEDCRRLRADAKAALQAGTDLAVLGPATPLATADGVAGVVVSLGSAHSEGLVFVACHHGLAVVASALGALGPQPAGLGTVDEMLGSVRFQ